MTKVIVQPAGSENAQAHFAHTITNRVALSRLEPLLTPQQRTALNTTFAGPDVPVWGVTRGNKDRNKNLFDKIVANDVLLFAQRKKVVATAPVLLTLHNADVARDLWGSDELGNTWEFLMLLGEVTPHDITYTAFNAVVGYQPNALLQDFRILDADKSAKALTLLGQASASGSNDPQGTSRVLLLTWNPESWPWADRDAEAVRVAAGESVALRWSIGNTRSIPVGTRAFILKQGDEPRGLVASGWTTREPFEDLHYDPPRAAVGETAFYVDIAPDVLAPTATAPVDPRTVVGPLAAVNWGVPASGTSLVGPAAEAVEVLWQATAGTATSTPEPVDDDMSALEGQVKHRMVAHRRRERALRDEKIRQVRAAHPNGQLVCEVPRCGFDFRERYGDLGEGYAQVHHRQLLADADKPVRTRLEDLAVVCANCHAMIHRGGKNRSLVGLISD